MSSRRESFPEGTISAKRLAIVRQPRGAKGSNSPRFFTRRSKYRRSTSETPPSGGARLIGVKSLCQCLSSDFRPVERTVVLGGEDRPMDAEHVLDRRQDVGQGGRGPTAEFPREGLNSHFTDAEALDRRLDGDFRSDKRTGRLQIGRASIMVSVQIWVV